MPEVSHFLDPAGLRVIEVLLVEDDPGDVLMTTEAFEMSPLHSTLHVVGDGEQALRFLRRTGEFSTSQAETDIAASYQLHANAYITKPVSLDLFTEAIRQVDDFFLTLVKLPG